MGFERMLYEFHGAPHMAVNPIQFGWNGCCAN